MGKEITLLQYIKAEHERLDAFRDMWARMADNDDYPDKMQPGDWEEQLIAFHYKPNQPREKQNAAPWSEGTQEQAPPPVAGLSSKAPSRPAEAAAPNAAGQPSDSRTPATSQPTSGAVRESESSGQVPVPAASAVHLYNAVGDYREQLDSDATSTPLYARPEAGTLFRRGEFTLHSGKVSDFKIDCDALTATDLDTLAAMIVKAVLEPFGSVEGVPTGGLRLAKALEKYATSGPLLIVDDVLTTGGSMKAHRGKRDAIGAVIFARGRCPIWVRPLFTMSQVPVPAAPTGVKGEFYPCKDEIFRETYEPAAAAPQDGK